MIVVAPCSFEDAFADTAGLQRALRGHELRVVPDSHAGAGELRDGEILVVNFEQQRSDSLDYVRAMPRLRWIHSLTAGIGALAAAEVAQREVTVTSGAGVFAGAIAEYVLAALVMLARGLPELVLAQVEHRWESGRPLARELAGARAGIIGYGGIGRRVAELLRAIGMHVEAVTRTPPGEAGVHGMERLPELLAGSDAIVVCASLNPATHGLLGDAELQRCRPGALLVNVARGALIDEAALARALREGPLGGAALDVTTTEPLPPRSPLWEVPNLWITPHLSGATTAALARALERFTDNLGLFAAGRTGELRGVVDVAREV